VKIASKFEVKSIINPTISNQASQKWFLQLIQSWQSI